MEVRLPSPLFLGPSYVTRTQSYTSLQNSSLITNPPSNSNSTIKDPQSESTIDHPVQDNVPDSTRTVSRARSSPCLTDTCPEIKPRCNTLEISSSETSTSYDPTQQEVPAKKVNQSTKVNLHMPPPDQSESASNAWDSSKLDRKQRTLLLYHHALTCRSEACSVQCCAKARKTLRHVFQCSGVNCAQNCGYTRNLVTHYKDCRDVACDTCAPVREAVRFISKRAPKVHGNGEVKNNEVHVRSNLTCSSSSGDLMKDCETRNECRVESAKNNEAIKEPTDQSVEIRDLTVNKTVKESKVESLEGPVCSIMNETNEEFVENMDLDAKVGVKTKDHSVTDVEINENESRKAESKVEKGKGLVIKIKLPRTESPKNKDLNVNMPTKQSTKQRGRGASLLDTFTPDQIKTHLMSLIQLDSKVKPKRELVQEIDQVPDQNTCSLCGMEELLFTPPPRYCAKCSVQIVSHGVYYSTDETGTEIPGFASGMETDSAPIPVSLSLCSRCYNSSGECIKLATKDMQKSCFKKQSNYAESDADSEWWVQCSKCEAWQHQICALFNGRRKEANAEYTCVYCFLKEIEKGECETLDPIRVLAAQDLPKTKLSDHLEKWLLDHLEIERKERAINSNKNVEEVPKVEGLCVRVVSCVDRVVNVLPHFFDFMKEENYPSEFPYKSKAIVLFQKIEGVDVCLFAMYVQEYGSKCPLPNQRHVYISYIDSIKYFQPEIRSSSGEALRTFVYHQLLIGYLDYCKTKGFASCSIWACPPTKHDDYILYCHPTSQKMPKAEKLRSWYQVMINRAVKEKVVVERTNIYDYYLIPTNDSRISVSSAHLPYCDNDFWPGEAERILSNNKVKSGAHKKVAEPKGRAVRAAKRGLMDGKPDDILLLHKLGERMRSLKDDFILVYLQPTCKHCRRAIVSSSRWACISCKNFLLCDRCYDEEEELPDKDKHPAAVRTKHSFHRVMGNAPADTDDTDPLMECEFFDSRIDLLRLCQNKMYQFDTLRRAKHSTMMILHHLHTPSCAACHAELDSDEDRWRCPVCWGYSMCRSCHSRVGSLSHTHELVPSSQIHSGPGTSKITSTGPGTGIASARTRKLESIFTQEVMEGLVHASRCGERGCEHPLCLKMKLLFQHGVRCKVKHWDCIRCKRMWQMMILHSRSCQDLLYCRVPRCRDVRNYERKRKAIRDRMQR